MVPDPRRYGLPDDYVFVHEEWGSLFYKHYGKQPRSEAKYLCKYDGAHLPYPRFVEENDFYRIHFVNESIWLDVENDPNVGLSNVDGHFYIRYFRSYTDKPNWMDESDGRPVSDVSFKNYNWVGFSDIHYPSSNLYNNGEVSKEVIMVDKDNGGWILAYENELIETVCVYNIMPDESCSKCPDEKFCRFTGSEREETICVCPETKTGDHCEIDLCARCQNGRFCEINDKTNEIQCKCPYPFYGENCEKVSMLLLSRTCSMVINSLGK